jgi:hypothetical protein
MMRDRSRNMAKVDDGMYGIKLILPDHLKFHYFTHPFDGTDGKWPLMNFSAEGRGPAVAANIPNGHRALVYVTKEQRFVQAIEFIGSVEDGARIAKLHDVPPGIHSQWSLYRPIRFLARIADVARAPTRDDIERLTGMRFNANSFTHTYISASDYERIYAAIDWDPPQRGAAE